jgi:multiple sugar transport system permease protein
MKSKLIRLLGLLFLAFFFVFPTLSMVVLSLQPDELQLRQDMGTLYAYIPRAVSSENYANVFDRVEFGRAFGNSLLTVILTILGGLLINSAIAYALARMGFRGRNTLVAAVIALSTIPFEAIAVPLLLMVNRLPWFDTLGLERWTWVNTYHVQIIPFLADAFSIFLFYQFFIGIPKDLEEAALIDGAGRWKMFTGLIIPLSLPVFATVTILQFIFKWGSFLWPLMTTIGKEFRPLTVAMQTFYGEPPLLWGDRLAFATMMTIPTLAVFLIFQRYFVRSQVSAGVK